MRADVSQSPRSKSSMARQLNRAGHGLLAVFLITLLSAAIPLRPLEPSWQLQWSNSLVNNGSIALLGVLLVALACWLNPEDGGLRRRHELLRRLCLIAVVAYLLVLPLQATALWRGINQRSVALQQRRQSAAQRLDAVAEVIEQAQTPAELQNGLRQIPGFPGLSDAVLKAPMPLLRQRLSASLEQARARLSGIDSQPNAQATRSLLQESFRIGLSALALAFAFAACAKGRDWHPTMLARTGGRGWNPNQSLLDNLQDDLHSQLRRKQAIPKALLPPESTPPS